MPSSVEERILSMRFNNTDFEKKASQSMSTLDKLDQKLRLSFGSEGFNKLDSALSSVSQKFSILGTVGDQVIRRITDSIINLTGHVTSLVKSLSVDQITAGWSKYADKTSAVQTIMAATAKDWEDTGAQMEYVNGQLEKLNWFTDETSYSFLDMVNNIGKFTSNGIKLEDSVVAMQGISTWAAISGANVQEAGRAMYNLSQALAVGSVKLMDWKSIENANMATREFKETALETAVNLGTLTKAADGSYKTLQGHVFTMEQFNTQLSDGWFSSEVLMKTLNQYGAFASKLQEASNATDYTATELLMAIDTYKKTGKVIPELSSYVQELSSSEYDLGYRSFKAAQEAKTFAEAIDSVKDAVSTGWMNTFENIFGNYQEAKELWTGLANGLYDIFAEGGNERNRILKEWRAFPIEIGKASKGLKAVQFDGPISDKIIAKTIDGRKILLNAMTTLGTSMVSILDTIKTSYNNIFPKLDAAKLIELTYKFRDFVNSIKPSESTLENLEKILTKVFGAFKNLKSVASSLIQPFKSLFSDILGRIDPDKILELATNFEEFTDSLKPSQEFLDKIKRILDGLLAVVDIGIMAISALAGVFRDKLAPPLLDIGGNLFDASANLADWLVNVRDSIKENDTFSQKLGSLSDTIASISQWLKDAKDAVVDFTRTFLGLEEGVTIWQKIKEVLGKIGEYASSALKSVKEFLDDVFGGEKLGGSGLIKSLAALLAAFFGFKKIKGIGKKNPLEQFIEAFKGGFEGIAEKVGKGLDLIGNAIDKFTKNTKADQLLKIAIAIGVLTASMVILSGVDAAKLAKALGVVAVGIGELMGSFALLGKIGAVEGKAATTLIKIAAAILVLSLAIKILSGIKMEDLAKAIVAVAASIAILVVAILLLSKMSAKSPALLSAGAAMIGIATAMIVMAGAVALFSLIPTDKLIKGIAAMSVSLLAVVAALILLSKFGKPVTILAAGAAIAAVAVAMVILVGAVAALAFIPVENLITGMIALGAILLVVTIALGILANVANPVQLLAAAAAMIIVSVALGIMVAAIGALFAMFLVDSDAALTAMIAFGALLVAMTIAIIALGAAGPMALVGAAALLILGVAMAAAAAAILILSVALNIITGLDLVGIAGGLALIGAAMIALGVGGLIAGLGVVGYAGLAILGLGLNMLDGLDLVGMAGGMALVGAALIPLGIGGLILGLGAAGLLVGAVGMIAIGLAMIPLSIGLKALKGVDQESILKFLEVLAISVAALAGLGLVCEAFAAGFIILGTACLEVGAGILMAGEGLEKIVNSLNNVPSVTASMLADTARAIADTLKTTRKDVSTELQGIIDDITSIISKNSKSIEASGEKVSSSLLDGIKKYNSNIVDEFGILMAECGNKITSNSTAISNDMGTLMAACYSKIESYIPRFSSASSRIATALSTGLKFDSGIVNKIDSSLANCVSVVSSYYNRFYYAAYYIVKGIADGIDRNRYLANDAVDRLSNGMLDRYRYMNQIHSPSRLYEEWARYIPEGIAKGISDNSGVAEDSIYDISNGMIAAISPALAILEGIINDQFDINPTIRPVVDLSDVQMSSTAIDGLFRNGTVGIKTTNDISGRISNIETNRLRPEETTTRVSAQSPVINTYIYTQPGQNTEDIANEVERRMVRNLNQRRTAFAR